MVKPDAVKEFLEKYEKELCEIIDQNTLSDEQLRDMVLTPEREEEIESGEFEVIEEELEEVGCPICMLPSGRLKLGECKGSGANAGCNIDYGECKRMRGRVVGSFHTHPIGPAVPSGADVNCAMGRKEGLFCVGARNADGTRTMRCFTPRPGISEASVGLRQIISSPFFGRPALPGVIGKIKFWRGVPEPTPTDVLENIEDWAAGYSEDEIKEFKKELRRGNIPQELWEGYEGPEGEWDELEIQNPRGEREHEETELALLGRDFEYMEKICPPREGEVRYGSRKKVITAPDEEFHRMRAEAEAQWIPEAIRLIEEARKAGRPIYPGFEEDVRAGRRGPREAIETMKRRL